MSKIENVFLLNIEKKRGLGSILASVLSYKYVVFNTKYDIIYNIENIDYETFIQNNDKPIINLSEIFPTYKFIELYKLNKFPEYYNEFKNLSYECFIWQTNKIYHSEHFQEIRNDFHKMFNTLKINENILNKVELNLKKIPDIENSLSITIRFSKLYYINKININFNIMISEIIKELEEIQHLYSNIILFTQVHEIKDILSNASFNKKIIIMDQINMYSNVDDWFKNPVDYKEEFENSLVDMLIASKSKQVMGGPSNMLITISFINTNNKIKLFKVLSDCTSG